MLAQAIRRLAVDRAERARMGRESRAWVVQNWSMELMAKRTLDLYCSCLDGGRKAAGSSGRAPDYTNCQGDPAT